VAGSRPSRLSSARILKELRTAARKGDRAALTLAMDQMRTLALSPRYWQKYLLLLRNPMARLVDLLAIKQGERIAHQKGWKLPGAGRTSPRSDGAPTAPPPSPGKTARPARSRPTRPARGRRRGQAPARSEAVQPSLFDA
jgi:hypothetical protein